MYKRNCHFFAVRSLNTESLFLSPLVKVVYFHDISFTGFSCNILMGFMENIAQG